MFIGNLVKLKDDAKRNDKYKEFVENAINENWIFLITNMDDEDLDYIIQPLYLDEECSKMIQLGAELLVLYDEIEKVEMNRKELFKFLHKLACNN
jgi:hypothetical protein